MSVVNCKVKYIRPKYNNLKEWINDDNNYYIGRNRVVIIDKQRYPDELSEFANPYKISDNMTRKQVIKKYETYIIRKLNKNISLVKKLLKLDGKNLGCWCYPEPCHGDILIKLIKKYKKKYIKGELYEYFEGDCSVCESYCNEQSGWQCVICDKCFCDEHNCEEFLCCCCD